MAKKKQVLNALPSSSPLATSPSIERTQEPPTKKQRRQSILIGDSPYRGKTGATPPESDSDEGKALKPKSLAPRRKRRIPRSAGLNPKDPFQCLGDDEVSMIITHLPAVATETLRRVSKLWKFKSEYHNGNEALRNHFDHVEGKKRSSYTNREDANLRFRRRLYHEQSLKAGRATSGFDITNASSWHINNGRLLWASYKNTYTIRNLSRRSETEAADIEVNLNEFLWMKRKFLYLADILLTENGDVVVVNECSASEVDTSSLSDPPESHYIRRLTPSGGNIIWEVYVSTTRRGIRYVYGKAAVDDNFMYRIETLKAVPMDRDYPLYFVTRRLDDGTTVLKKQLPEALGTSLCDWLGKFPASADLELRICGAWAVHAASRSPQVNIFNSSTGELLMTYMRTMPSTLTVSAAENAVYNLDFRFNRSNPSEFLEWDGTLMQFTRSTRNLIQQHRINTSGLGFDPDRKFFFRIHHSVTRPDNVSHTNDPFTQFSVINAQENENYTGCSVRSPNHHPPQTFLKNVHAFTEEDNVSLITLPAAAVIEKKRRRKGKKENEKVLVNERRMLQLAAPWSIRGGDFFGMVDDYLVYYAKGEHRLMVVDFWPTW